MLVWAYAVGVQQSIDRPIAAPVSWCCMKQSQKSSTMVNRCRAMFVWNKFSICHKTNEKILWRCCTQILLVYHLTMKRAERDNLMTELHAYLPHRCTPSMKQSRDKSHKKGASTLTVGAGVLENTDTWGSHGMKLWWSTSHHHPNQVSTGSFLERISPMSSSIRYTFLTTRTK